MKRGKNETGKRKWVAGRGSGPAQCLSRGSPKRDHQNEPKCLKFKVWILSKVASYIFENHSASSNIPRIHSRILVDLLIKLCKIHQKVMANPCQIHQNDAQESFGMHLGSEFVPKHLQGGANTRFLKPFGATRTILDAFFDPAERRRGPEIHNVGTNMHKK